MSSTGRASFAVLLLQDLAVVPMLLLVNILGADNGPSIATGVMMALAQAALAVALIVRDRAAAAAAVLPAGRRHRDAGAVRRRHPVRDRRHRRGGGGGGTVDGARRLRRRPDPGRERIPQADRGDHRSVQGPAARHVLLHGRHGRGLPRDRARAVPGAGRGGRPDRPEGPHPDRPGAAVRTELGILDRDGPAARPRRRVRLRRHRARHASPGSSPPTSAPSC